MLIYPIRYLFPPEMRNIERLNCGRSIFYGGLLKSYIDSLESILKDYWYHSSSDRQMELFTTFSPECLFITNAHIAIFCFAACLSIFFGLWGSKEDCLPLESASKTFSQRLEILSSTPIKLMD